MDGDIINEILENNTISFKDRIRYKTLIPGACTSQFICRDCGVEERPVEWLVCGESGDSGNQSDIVCYQAFEQFLNDQQAEEVRAAGRLYGLEEMPVRSIEACGSWGGLPSMTLSIAPSLSAPSSVWHNVSVRGHLQAALI